jgi:hypothetical protein
MGYSYSEMNEERKILEDNWLAAAFCYGMRLLSA